MGPLVYSYSLSRDGNHQKINTMPDEFHENEFYWFHLSANHKKSIEWLEHHTDMSDVAINMLTSKNTRPNVVKFPNGLLITFRAVNTSEDDSGDVFNAINIWISEHYILTSRNIKIMAISDIATMIDDGDGPRTKGEFLVQLIHHLQKRISQVVRDVESQTEALEEEVLNREHKDIRTKILSHRKLIVQIRKYLVPQRETLQTLTHEKFLFLHEDSIIAIRYYYDKMVRLVEELDIAKEHVLLIQEEIVNIQNDLMNRSMYRISIISALFLPLGFITGLLGVNIGGVPGIENSNAFMILSFISGIYLILSTLYFVIQKRL